MQRPLDMSRAQQLEADRCRDQHAEAPQVESHRRATPTPERETPAPRAQPGRVIARTLATGIGGGVNKASASIAPLAIRRRRSARPGRTALAIVRRTRGTARPTFRPLTQCPLARSAPPWAGRVAERHSGFVADTRVRVASPTKTDSFDSPASRGWGTACNGPAAPSAAAPPRGSRSHDAPRRSAVPGRRGMHAGEPVALEADLGVGVERDSFARTADRPRWRS